MFSSVIIASENNSLSVVCLLTFAVYRLCILYLRIGKVWCVRLYVCEKVPLLFTTGQEGNENTTDYFCRNLLKSRHTRSFLVGIMSLDSKLDNSEYLLFA